MHTSFSTEQNVATFLARSEGYKKNYVTELKKNVQTCQGELRMFHWNAMCVWEDLQNETIDVKITLNINLE